MDANLLAQRVRTGVLVARGALVAGLGLAAAGCAAPGATGGGSAPATAVPAAAPAAAAGDWKSVATADSQEAFVDLASRRDRDGFVEAAVRYDYAQPQAYGKKTYSSARTVYRFDCAGRRLADRENLVYAGSGLSGAKVGDATRSTKNLVWRDVASSSVDGAVLDYVCRKMAP